MTRQCPKLKPQNPKCQKHQNHGSIQNANGKCQNVEIPKRPSKPQGAQMPAPPPLGPPSRQCTPKRDARSAHGTERALPSPVAPVAYSKEAICHLATVHPVAVPDRLATGTTVLLSPPYTVVLPCSLYCRRYHMRQILPCRASRMLPCQRRPTTSCYLGSPPADGMRRKRSRGRRGGQSVVCARAAHYCRAVSRHPQ